MITSFNEYQERTADTDIIKPEVRVVYYPLGLNGEAGETVEKIDAMMLSNGYIKDEHKPLIALELGDVMWYVARMSALLGIRLGGMLSEDAPGIFQNKTDEEETSDYTTRYLAAMHALSSNAGKVADAIKKCIRDNDGHISVEKRIEVVTALIMVTKSVALLAAWLGYPMGEVLQMNIDKLASRKERGKIGGSGDER